MYVDEQFDITNVGGETHTFTEVQKFGGGIALFLNFAGDDLGRPVLYQCCIHMDAGDAHGRPVDFSPDAYPTRAGEDFDPQQLQTPATLNRTRLADVPGAHAEWVGKRAFELLSLEALRQVASDRAAEVFGRRLGHLVATLHRGAELEPESSAWRHAYLEHWSAVEEVWLGGGLAAALGEGLAKAAQIEATRLGADSVAIHLTQHPAELPLMGAARSNWTTSSTAVVLDFGHTAIKRGVAHYQGGALRRLDVLPPVAAPEDRETAPAAVADVITAMGTNRPVVASVASYVNSDGTLAESHSRYALVNPSTSLRLQHDGTFAARGVQPSTPRAAVIMLGTALGVGFAPPAHSLRPLAPDFELRVLRTT